MDEDSIIEVAESRDLQSTSAQKFSTTEYLPCMIHVHSPIGILPRYPSWGLVCLGPSSLYSHNAGVFNNGLKYRKPCDNFALHTGLSDQPGFLTGSAFLLPWDVTVRVQQNETTLSDGRRP